jgi:hypothetical protein
LAWGLRRARVPEGKAKARGGIRNERNEQLEAIETRAQSRGNRVIIVWQRSSWPRPGEENYIQVRYERVEGASSSRVRWLSRKWKTKKGERKF